MDYVRMEFNDELILSGSFIVNDVFDAEEVEEIFRMVFSQCRTKAITGLETVNVRVVGNTTVIDVDFSIDVSGVNVTYRKLENDIQLIKRRLERALKSKRRTVRVVE